MRENFLSLRRLKYPADWKPTLAVLKCIGIFDILRIYDSVLAEPNELLRTNLLALIIINHPSKGQ